MSKTKQVNNANQDTNAKQNVSTKGKYSSNSSKGNTDTTQKPRKDRNTIPTKRESTLRYVDAAVISTDICSILQKQLPMYSVLSTKNAEELENIYLGLNVFFSYLTDIGLQTQPILSYLLSKGLIGFLESLDDYKSFLTHGEYPAECDAGNINQWIHFCAPCTLAQSFQVASLLKRLQLHSIDCDGFPKFLEDNRGMAYWPMPLDDSGRTRISYKLIYELREILAWLFKDFDVALDSVRNHFTLPPGSTAEGLHTYYEKFCQVLRNQQWLRDNGLPFPVVMHSLAYKQEEPVDYCEYQEVPKNWKTRRGIAPEATSKQVLAYQIDEAMRFCLAMRSFDLRDQTPNQRAAAEGAITNGIATVDKSAASDSISVGLVVETLPTNVLNELRKVRSKWVRHNKKLYKSFRWTTMGNASTFSLETAIFVAIAILSVQYYYLLAQGEWLSNWKAASLINVYGDDVTIPSEVYETYCDIARAFGFRINFEKSYANGLYRESCGKEYWGYDDVTPVYYPRGTSISYYSELISLQHKFVEYPRVNLFLTMLIRSVKPSVTYSSVGSNHDDLWNMHYQRTPYKDSVYGEYYQLAVTKVPEDSSSNGIKLKRTGCNHTKYLFTWYKGLGKLTVEQGQLHTAVPGAQIFPLYPYGGDRSCHFRKITYQKQKPQDICKHTTNSTVWEHKDVEYPEIVELLAYYLTIGGGVERINNSTFTKPTDKILNKDSFVGKGKNVVMTKDYFD